jgi:phosphoglycerate dehydrogenase-like enzyme
VVRVHDPYAEPVDVAAAGARAVTLDELLETADFVSLHAPLDESTRGMIGADELARMKRGATLINTGRGGLVDEAALVRALDQGHLAAVGLDVFADEPVPPGSALGQRPDVVVTPHSASFSEEALAEVRRRAIADTIRLLNGKRPRDPVPA